jgi:hypothetical protein
MAKKGLQIVTKGYTLQNAGRINEGFTLLKWPVKMSFFDKNGIENYAVIY